MPFILPSPKAKTRSLPMTLPESSRNRSGRNCFGSCQSSGSMWAPCKFTATCSIMSQQERRLLQIDRTSAGTVDRPIEDRFYRQVRRIQLVRVVLANVPRMATVATGSSQTTVGTGRLSRGCHQWLEWCAFLGRPEIPYRRCRLLPWFQLQSPWTNMPVSVGHTWLSSCRRRFCCCTRRLRCHRKVGLGHRIRHRDVPCDTSILPWYECDTVWSFTIGSQ